MTLQEIRRKKFLTQVDLANMTGLHQMTIQRLEAGTHKPKFKTVKLLAEALGVRPEKIEF